MDIIADVHDGCLIESMTQVGTEATNHRGFSMTAAIPYAENKESLQ